MMFLLVSAALGAAAPGLYGYENNPKSKLSLFDATGALTEVGPVAFDPWRIGVGTQEVAVVPENGMMYMLGLNESGGRGHEIPVISAVSLADASVAFMIPSPLAYAGGYVGTGQSIHYGTKGKLILTGISPDTMLHTAWSMDTTQGHTFTKLSEGFLVNSTLDFDPSVTLDYVNNILWRIVPPVPRTHMGFTLVGIKLDDGTEAGRYTLNRGTDRLPSAMEFDASSGKLICTYYFDHRSYVMAFDTTTFEQTGLGEIVPGKGLYKGISTFDRATRTMYVFTRSDEENGRQQIIGFSVATKKVTLSSAVSSTDDITNIAFLGAPSK